jgi:hypothetical protein
MTSLLKKEEMNPRLGGSTDMLLIYSKLGLELVSLEENHSRTPKKPSMVEEKKNDGADDPISLLLEQALT